MGYFKSNATAWLNSEQQVVDRAEDLIGATILQRATVLAPVDTGDLRDNGRVVKNPTGGRSIVFGDADVPYARIHELGGVTGRGYKTKIVAKHYLQTAGDSVAKENIKKYVDLAR